MRINTREKILLIIMVTVLIAWFSFDLIIENQLTELVEKDSLIRLKEQELSELQSLLDSEKDIDKKMEAQYEIIDEVAKEYFNTTPQYEMILLMNDFLRMPNISNNGITFNSPVIEEFNGISFERTSINIDFSGPYLSVMNLFKTMWAFPQMVKIDQVSMASAGYDETAGNLTLSTYTFLAESKVVDNLYQLYTDETFLKDNPFQQMEENDVLVRYLYLQDNDELFNYSRFFEFVDIEGHWLQSEIEEYLDYGYLYLTPTLEFQPDEPITRGEFIVLVDSVYDWPSIDPFDAVDDEVPDLTSFRDYEDLGSLESSFAKAIHRGYLSGFIEGFDDNTLRPRDPITYLEVEFLMRRIKGNEAFTWESVTNKLRQLSGERKPEWTTDDGLLTKAEAIYLLYYNK